MCENVHYSDFSICVYHYFSQTIGTKPVAHVDQFTADMLGSAELAEEVSLNGSGKLIKVTILKLSFYLPFFFICFNPSNT